MRGQCHGQRQSLTVQLNSRLVRRIELYTKVCSDFFQSAYNQPELAKFLISKKNPSRYHWTIYYVNPNNNHSLVNRRKWTSAKIGSKRTSREVISNWLNLWKSQVFLLRVLNLEIHGKLAKYYNFVYELCYHIWSQLEDLTTMIIKSSNIPLDVKFFLLQVPVQTLD